VLFGPGIPDLHREAQREEIVLWRACAAPRRIGALVRRKRRRPVVIRLVTEGILDIVAGKLMKREDGERHAATTLPPSQFTFPPRVDCSKLALNGATAGDCGALDRKEG
jgi:hypothetical protein